MRKLSIRLVFKSALRRMFPTVLVFLLMEGRAHADAHADEALVKQYYEQRIRPLALRTSKCSARQVPKRVDMIDSPMVQAGAFLEQPDPNELRFEPRIGLHRGLLEFAGAIAYHHVSGKRDDWRAALELVYFKAQKPAAALLGTTHTKTWEQQRNPLWAWDLYFLSRISFAIAHELAHHCLDHTVRGGMSLAGLRDTKGTLLPWNLGVDAQGLGDSAAARNLEIEADEWALKFLIEHRGPLELGLSHEAMASAFSELALLDAAMGRTLARASASPWSHPVERERFDPLFRIARSAAADEVPYVRGLANIITCIRVEDEPLHALRTLLDEDLVCPSISSTQSALRAFLVSAAPPLRASAHGVAVSLFHRDGGVAQVTARREQLSAASFRVVDARPAGAGTAWEATFDKGASYILNFQGLSPEGQIDVRVDHQLVGIGIVKQSKLVEVRVVDGASPFKTSLANGLLKVQLGEVAK